jgi:S-adenosylmethionine decarboxylase
VKIAGMTKLSPVTVYKAEPNGKKDTGGYTGFVVVTESHIALHTFAGAGYFSLDIYTCGDSLDTVEIERYLTNAFGVKKTDKVYLRRGKKYYKYYDSGNNNNA